MTTTRPRPPKEGPLERITAVIAKIPRGRVMTYGEVAAVAGYPRAPRLTVYALNQGGASLPWHRVLGRQGARFAHVSIKEPRSAQLQRRLLIKEGVRFDEEGRVLLERYGWLGATEPEPSGTERGRDRRRR